LSISSGDFLASGHTTTLYNPHYPARRHQYLGSFLV
jgi:hypothetical protein